VDWPGLAALVLAGYGAGLSTILAVRGWHRGRTRIGITYDRFFPIGSFLTSWEWFCARFTLLNYSALPCVITQVQVGVPHPDAPGKWSLGNLVSIIEHEGESAFYDPESDARVKLRQVRITPLALPVVLDPRSHATGWLAFRFEEQVSRERLQTLPLVVVATDQDGREHVVALGVPESRPFATMGEMLRDVPPEWSTTL